MNNFKLKYIKADARKHLENMYSLSIECIIVYYTFLFFLLFIQLSFPSNKAGLQTAIFYFAVYLINVVITKLNFGLNGFYLKLCCKDAPKISDLFECLFKSTDHTTPIASVICLIKFFFSMIAIIFLSQYDLTTVKGIKVYACVLLLNILANIYITIIFMPVSYLVHDIKDKTATQILSLSIWLMKGYKRKLLLLYLSFVPLFLLGFLSCGIGLLWVCPYFYSTQTSFYLKLTRIKSNIQ